MLSKRGMYSRFLAGLLIAVALLWAVDVSAATRQDETYAKIKILSQVLFEIQEKYVEDREAQSLIYGAIKGMVATLDPHSTFLTPEEFKEFQVETQGSFSGVGIEITLREGYVTVVSPIEDTPAHAAGVRAGDVILEIDGQTTKDMTLLEAVRLIRGPQGTTVVLTIRHEDEDQPVKVPIVREVIPLQSVRSEILEEGYGYLRISSFQAATEEDAEKALVELLDKHGPLKGLILDLRNNPGGLLNQAVRLADLFLQKGVIVATKGRIPEQNMEFKAHRSAPGKDVPLVALVNEGSASASEIVAGALQDQKRAVIVGAKTFGKGSVQTIIPFRDGSGLRLTTARYYTPSGRSIQATGIVPDVLVPSRLSPRAHVVREKDLEGHLRGEEEIAGPEEKKGPPAGPPQAAPEGEKETKPLEEMTLEERLRNDPQLKKALEMLKGGEVLPRLKAAKTAE